MGQKIIKMDGNRLQTVNLSIFHKCWMCRWKDIFDCHIDCCIQTSHTSYYYTVTASRTGYSSYCEHSPVCRCTSACTASSWFADKGWCKKLRQTGHKYYTSHFDCSTFHSTSPCLNRASFHIGCFHIDCSFHIRYYIHWSHIHMKVLSYIHIRNYILYCSQNMAEKIDIGLNIV